MTEAQFSAWAMKIGLTVLVIFLGFIVYDLGKKSNAGKFGMFQADGDAQQAFADAGGVFRFWLHFAVCGRPRVRDGGAHVAQVGGFGEDFNVVEQFPRGFLPAPDFKRQDDAAARLLFFHQFGLRVVGEAGMVNALDLRLPPQPFGDFFGIGTLPFDTQR